MISMAPAKEDGEQTAFGLDPSGSLAVGRKSGVGGARMGDLFSSWHCSGFLCPHGHGRRE